MLIGAHCSASGGVDKAIDMAVALQATTLQLFTANQKRWVNPPLKTAAIDRWLQRWEETGLQLPMSHDSYLINLGSPTTDVREKSILAMEQEIERCRQLAIPLLNFHPGSALKEPRVDCIAKIIESLCSLARLVQDGELTLLYETTAGQGSQVGSTFEEIATLVEGVKDALAIGVCIDTCHIFAAGYDLRTKESVHACLDEFDRIVGLQWLKAIHLNDSLKPCGSKVDRHAALGEGEIGWEGIEALITDPRLAHLPFYLETPLGVEVWKKEIAHIKALTSRCSDQDSGERGSHL